MISAKRLHFTDCIILPSRNKSFSQNPFEFLHIRESLVSRSSRLETLYSRLERFKHRGSRIESRGSSFECQLTFEWYCIWILSPRWPQTVFTILQVCHQYFSSKFGEGNWIPHSLPAGSPSSVVTVNVTLENLSNGRFRGDGDRTGIGKLGPTLPSLPAKIKYLSGKFIQWTTAGFRN